MQPYKRLLAGFLAALLLVAASACSTTGSGSKKGGDPVKTVTLEAAKPLAAFDFSDSAGEAAAVHGMNDFSFRLAKELNKSGENVILSPFSVWMALAALANATEGDVGAALLTSLGIEGLTSDELNTAASKILSSLTNAEYSEYDAHDPLTIANAIFVDSDYTLRKEFAQSFLDYYRGNAMAVDFASPDAVAAVNDWASEHTNGLIDEIVQGFDPDTVAAIANAIYFSDRWDTEFNADLTRDDIFHGVNGDATAAFMYRQGDFFPYYEDSSLQMVQLPFVSNVGSLYILLPTDGDADALMNSLDAASFAQLLSKRDSKSGELYLPRFDIDSSYSLGAALQTLGVPLFDTDSITKLVEEDPLFITQAVHKATISVDEKGTTAAAVTVMAMAGAGMPEENAPFLMKCDRPFVFVLTGSVRGAGEAVLFTGAVKQL